MFDHGKCAHLIRIALIEEIALPGKVAHKKQRDKAKKLAEKIIKSDQEFEENINLIEMQSNTQSQVPTQLQAQTQLQAPTQLQDTTGAISRIEPKKRGMKKNDTLPKALEKSPDITKTQNLPRSQRSKK